MAETLSIPLETQLLLLTNHLWLIVLTLLLGSFGYYGRYRKTRGLSQDDPDYVGSRFWDILMEAAFIPLCMALLTSIIAAVLELNNMIFILMLVVSVTKPREFTEMFPGLLKMALERTVRETGGTQSTKDKEPKSESEKDDGSS